MRKFRFLQVKNKKRGFTLVETVVGLTIIAIVATAALSLYFHSEKAVQSAHQKQQAQFHVSNIIACYRVSSDVDSFKKNLAFALDLETTGVNMGENSGIVDLGDEYSAFIDFENEFSQKIKVEIKHNQKVLAQGEFIKGGAIE
jgi:prepilin-type N-terminal cleavage/methylation domain-containing protein